MQKSWSNYDVIFQLTENICRTYNKSTSGFSSETSTYQHDCGFRTSAINHYRKKEVSEITAESENSPKPGLMTSVKKAAVLQDPNLISSMCNIPWAWRTASMWLGCHSCLPEFINEHQTEQISHGLRPHLVFSKTSPVSSCFILLLCTRCWDTLKVSARQQWICSSGWSRRMFSQGQVQCSALRFFYTWDVTDVLLVTVEALI